MVYLKCVKNIFFFLTIENLVGFKGNIIINIIYRKFRDMGVSRQTKVNINLSGFHDKLK